MITKFRFNNLKKGDFLLFVTPTGKTKVREVSADTKNVSVILKRINSYRPYGGKNTVYTYSDVYKKIIGVWKIKNKI